MDERRDIYFWKSLVSIPWVLINKAKMKNEQIFQLRVPMQRKNA